MMSIIAKRVTKTDGKLFAALANITRMKEVCAFATISTTSADKEA